MPELPEVETIAYYLRGGSGDRPSLLGKQIAGGVLLWPPVLETASPEAFSSRLAGQCVQEIGRRGKFLQMLLSHDWLLFHLRMSGDLWVEAQTAPVATHHRAMLQFTDGLRLAFNDPRKFGRIWLTDQPETILQNLGPEPLDPRLSAQDFYTALQSFLAGLGNIYTDEALHLAKIHPLAQSDSLSFGQAERLLESIRLVLQEGIARHGASIDWVYRGGDFQNYFRVYQRTGSPCPVCGTLIERIVVGQRGTHFCPTCQPLG
jgi:formamidopyrimidine-DNA glycosylase